MTKLRSIFVAPDCGARDRLRDEMAAELQARQVAFEAEQARIRETSGSEQFKKAMATLEADGRERAVGHDTGPLLVLGARCIAVTIQSPRQRFAQ